MIYKDILRAQNFCHFIMRLNKNFYVHIYIYVYTHIHAHMYVFTYTQTLISQYHSESLFELLLKKTWKLTIFNTISIIKTPWLWRCHAGMTEDWSPGGCVRSKAGTWPWVSQLRPAVHWVWVSRNFTRWAPSFLIRLCHRIIKWISSLQFKT